MKVLFAIFMLSLSVGALAKAPKSKVSAVSEKPNVEIRVQTRLGETSTNYHLQGGNKGFKMTLKNPKIKTRTVRLGKRDFEFILSEFEKLPQAKVVPKECARSRVDISVSKKKGSSVKKSSCIAVNSITSPQYHRFITILTMAQ